MQRRLQLDGELPAGGLVPGSGLVLSGSPGPQMSCGYMVQTLWGCLGVGDTRPHIVRTRAHVQPLCQMARRGRALIPRGGSRSIAMHVPY